MNRCSSTDHRGSCCRPPAPAKCNAASPLHYWIAIFALLVSTAANVLVFRGLSADRGTQVTNNNVGALNNQRLAKLIGQIEEHGLVPGQPEKRNP